MLELIRNLQQKRGMAVMLITHDLGVVAEMADRVAVMYAGQLVEQAPREVFFGNSQHPYSDKLFAALPDSSKRERRLTVIPGTVPPLNRDFSACRFADRCEQVWEHCRSHEPTWFETGPARGVRCHLADPGLPDRERRPTESPQDTQTRMPVEAAAQRSLLDVDKLTVHFPIHKGLFKRVVGQVRAVDGVSLSIASGQTLALVGESGCGKTTVGKGILQLVDITAGRVRFEELELTELKGEGLRRRRADFQIIFQDPFSSMNPRMSVGDIVEEGMTAQGLGGKAPQRKQRVHELLQQVGLRPEHARRYPHEFSGGQRQRICIARALAVNPKLIVCDEPTSALDVSVQAQILNLLQDLQAELGLSFLFISHDLSVVSYLADRVAVMYLGRIVEQGDVTEVLDNPQHPYSQALLSAAPSVDAGGKRHRIRLEGDLPSPANPPQGCHFHPRCPEAMPQCRQSYPGLTRLTKTHQLRCHLFEGR